MTPRARFYIIIVVAAAGVLILAMPWHVTMVFPIDALRLASLTAVSVFAEGMAIDFRLGPGKQSQASLAFIPFLSIAILFPPIIAVATVGTVIAISQFALRRHDFFRGSFNVGQGLLSAGVAALTYHAFAASPEGVDYWAFVPAASAFFCVNILLNTGAIALIKGLPFVEVLEQVAGARGSNLWYDLLASPIALVIALLDRQLSAAAALIIVLPLLLIRSSYLSKVRLEETIHDLLKVLVKAIETRDPYTSGHSMRVATLARAIAQDINLPRAKVHDVYVAALLHDIGKIDSVYAAVIQKPYDLNDDERALIKTHATKGADLLQSLTSLPPELIRSVRHHHERFDGSGYPDGLAGDGIPLAARIIMLCDSIDAMLSDRPYRRALSMDHVHRELIRCSGTQFDPEIVNIILRRSSLERAARLVEEWGRAPAEERLVLTS